MKSQVQPKPKTIWPSSGDLLERVDFFRLDAGRKLDPTRRAEMGQFFTPPPTARLMASMFDKRRSVVRLLDAGAGVGSLTAAWVNEVCGWRKPPESVEVTTYEIDRALVEYLRMTLEECRVHCAEVGIQFEGKVIERDFIEEGTAMLEGGLFAPPVEAFDCAILNPPYRKINSDSETRRQLQSIGVETSNLYTGFLSIVVRLLEPGGELVAITPRSCSSLHRRSCRVGRVWQSPRRAAGRF